MLSFFTFMQSNTMNIEPYVAVSGMPGIYKIVNSRSNGLVVEDLDSGKVKFCPTRKHQFTPLGTVAIYTLDDTEPLNVVFQTMLDKQSSLPPVPHNSKNHELFEYFEGILPNWDEDRVYASDIKKIIKWYNFLNERNLLTTSDEEE